MKQGLVVEYREAYRHLSNLGKSKFSGRINHK